MKVPVLAGRRVRSLSSLAIWCVLFAASIPLHCEEPVVSIGKQRAARSAIEWDVHDTDHPLLGPIKFAGQKAAVTTTVGNEKILSLAFVSCQKSSGKVAIELANATGSDLAGGLAPADVPRLVCSSPDPRDNRSLVKNDIAARWAIDRLGDALARGLSPSELRRCVSIGVLQDVALPPGSSQSSQRIEIEITPYNRALDAVFSACGETTVFALVEQAPPALPQVARPGPAPERDPRARSVGEPWKSARTAAKGKTNVRAAPAVDSPLVMTLDPGTRIRVRRTSAPWWEVKPRSGEGFRGYVRQDRLAFE